MASYVVMEPPAGGSDDAVLVRDGFHVFAFILPVIWLLFNRLWLETLAVLAAGMVIGGVGSWLGAGLAASVASFLLAVFIGLEGASLKVAALRRRGWREWGVVEADDAEDAETRYLAEVEETLAKREYEEEPAFPSGRPALPVRPRPSGPVLGMLHGTRDRLALGPGVAHGAEIAGKRALVARRQRKPGPERAAETMANLDAGRRRRAVALRRGGGASGNRTAEAE